MDKYYGNVCELDIIFNFQKAYFILDELLLAGEMQESSKKNVLRVIGAQDGLEEMEVSHIHSYYAPLDAPPQEIPFRIQHQLIALPSRATGRGRRHHQDWLKPMHSSLHMRMLGAHEPDQLTVAGL